MYPIFHRFLHFVWKVFLVSNNLPYKSRTGILSLIGWGQQIWSISWCNFLSRLWHTCTYTDVHAHTYIHGPLTRCVKWRVAHAPGMPGTFLPHRIQTKPLVSDHSMHFGIVNPRWRGKRSRHSRRMRNPRFYVSGKRPMYVSAWIYRTLRKLYHMV